MSDDDWESLTIWAAESLPPGTTIVLRTDDPAYPWVLEGQIREWDGGVRYVFKRRRRDAV